MSKPQNTHRTVDEIVREYLIENGDSSLHKYGRVLSIAFSGLRDINMDVSGLPKEAVIEVNSNGTVSLPDDFVEYISIGVLTSNGNVGYLSHNGRMGLPRTYDDCGDIGVNAADSGSEEGISYRGNYFRNGEFTGRLFGLGGGGSKYGYFKMDYTNNFIAIQDLNDDFSEIYLEYLADIETMNGEHLVHPYVVECLKSWIYWKDIQKNRFVGRGEKLDAKAEYKSEKKKSRKRFSKFNMREAAESMRKANKLAPRF